MMTNSPLRSAAPLPISYPNITEYCTAGDFALVLALWHASFKLDFYN